MKTRFIFFFLSMISCYAFSQASVNFKIADSLPRPLTDREVRSLSNGEEISVVYTGDFFDEKVTFVVKDGRMVAVRSEKEFPPRLIAIFLIFLILLAGIFLIVFLNHLRDKKRRPRAPIPIF